MRSLAIDSSTGVLGLAVRRDDASAALTLRRGLEHAPSLLPSVKSLMAQVSLSPEELQLIVCSTGPGSFTGIRIGLATAKGIAFGLSCPLVGVSSLDAFAAPYAAFEGDVYSVIDARKGRIYAALYRGGERKSGYLDVTPEELEGLFSADARTLLAGPDAEDIRRRLAHPERFRTAPYMDPLSLLDAGEREFAAGGAQADGPAPLYLRKSEAEIGAGR